MRTMAEAFDEWMDRYIKDPDGFEREFKSVLQYLSDSDHGREHSYGVECAAYLRALMDGK